MHSFIPQQKKNDRNSRTHEESKKFDMYRIVSRSGGEKQAESNVESG